MWRNTMNLTPNHSGNLTFNHLSMPYLRAFVGLTLILLSLYATISFLSQGFTGLAFLGIVVFCLAIESIKVLFSGDIGFYLALKAPEKALFAFVMVAILFCLSVGAETWFLLSGSLKGATQIEQTAKQTETLQAQIDAKQVQLDKCNPSSLSKCVNPRTAELSELQAQMTALSASAVANEEAVSNAKFWAQIAEATGTSPENLQLGLNVMRSILQELFGLYLLAQFSTWKRLSALTSISEEDFEAETQRSIRAAERQAEREARTKQAAREALAAKLKPLEAPVMRSRPVPPPTAAAAPVVVKESAPRAPKRSSQGVLLDHISMLNDNLRREKDEKMKILAASGNTPFDKELDAMIKSVEAGEKPTPRMDMSKLGKD
jgi:hypothetical protein